MFKRTLGGMLLSCLLLATFANAVLGDPKSSIVKLSTHDDQTGYGVLTAVDGKLYVYLPQRTLFDKKGISLNRLDGTQLTAGKYELALSRDLARIEIVNGATPENAAKLLSQPLPEKIQYYESGKNGGLSSDVAVTGFGGHFFQIALSPEQAKTDYPIFTKEGELVGLTVKPFPELPKPPAPKQQKKAKQKKGKKGKAKSPAVKKASPSTLAVLATGDIEWKELSTDAISIISNPFQDAVKRSMDYRDFTKLWVKNMHTEVPINDTWHPHIKKLAELHNDGLTRRKYILEKMDKPGGLLDGLQKTLLKEAQRMADYGEESANYLKRSSKSPFLRSLSAPSVAIFEECAHDCEMEGERRFRTNLIPKKGKKGKKGKKKK